MGVAGRRRVAMRLPCNTLYNFMLFTNYVCIYFHVVAKINITNRPFVVQTKGIRLTYYFIYKYEITVQQHQFMTRRFM